VTGSPVTVAEWLPSALRQRPTDEAEAPRVLDALLAAVDGQRERLAAEIDSVWDDFFIDSCADWAVPYIATLVGLPADAERAEVAHAIALRRRKGTRAALEEFAEVITGWSALAKEGWQTTIWAQRLGYPPPARLASINLHDRSRYRVGTPFEKERRSFTPSRIWAPRAVTAIVWPWRIRTYENTEAVSLVGGGYALHPLGAESPLYLRPRPRSLAAEFGSDVDVAELTGDERDAPVRATYRVVEALASDGQITYGATWALGTDHPLVDVSDRSRPALALITANGVDVRWSAVRLGAVPPAAAPGVDELVLDLARGRVALGTNLVGPVRATWHRPSAGEIGALAGYADADHSAEVVIRVNPSLAPGPLVAATLDDAITLAQNHVPGPGAISGSGDVDVEIRLESSDQLQLARTLVFSPALKRWRIVATRTNTPAIVGNLTINLDDACVTLEGFYLKGDLVLGDKLSGVHLRNVTIDPSNTIRVDDKAWRLSLSLERCLVGRIRADLGAVPISITDSIVDGRGDRMRPCGGPSGGTLGDAVAKRTRFGPSLRAKGVTFVGPVRVEAIDATDTLFVDGFEVVQQQEGCVRHSYLGPDLSNPPTHPTTYRCISSPAPTFASTGFEAAGYYALELDRDDPLLTAASDGGEVGAYHHARRAMRFGRLRSRIHEFVPLGLRARAELAGWEE
jgi:hypothetical protein